ncbi:MAG: hypothetical protein LN413_03320 [Candidatus Thermoplasmatota archaeon]|nr:hypothetical protein [Candidatus Thermoplasmatota archaeon]
MSEGRDIFGVVITHVPLLVARLGSSALRLLFGSRRAAWSFRRALRKKGISRRRARQLAGRYRRQVDILRIVRRVLRERPWE